MKIPNEDPTLLAAREALVAGYQAENREYLGMSGLGRPCERQVWYEFNGAPREPFDADTLLRFADGHHSEEVVREMLRAVDGIELVGDQYEVEDFDGRLKGHFDGVVRGLKQAPKTWHIWEHKCVGASTWASFKKAKATHGEKGALKEWNRTYYGQAQLYMHYAELKRHYLTVASAGTRELDSCRTEYDGAEVKALKARAERILNNEEPPRIDERPEFWLCRWCDYRGICHS